MQYDMYHVYTVDEHTIRAIEILDGIFTGRLKAEHPISYKVIREVKSRRALFVYITSWTLQRAVRRRSPILGAQVAEKLCPRLGLTEWETETVVWLVRWHLLMTHVAFKRDLEDAKTILDFI